MHTNENKKSGGFPDPLRPREDKESNGYGLEYAKAIESQWGQTNDSGATYKKRNNVFERNRDYANGTQDTNIYKQLLTSLNPNNSDGSLTNLDYTPVPILPKFARIVSNKILSKEPYPNLEAVDPISSSEKNKEKVRITTQVQVKKELAALKEETGGLVLDKDPDQLPDTLEEAEIFLSTNIKTDAEIAAQIGTNMTLQWAGFNDNVFRRNVNDLVACGMAVVKRSNDPNYGIKPEYVDPVTFIHSFTEDPNFEDIVYAGHIKSITIQELKRLAGDSLKEADYKGLAENAARSKSHSTSSFSDKGFDHSQRKSTFGYDDYMIDVLDFEFLSVDSMHFEEKENRHGNNNFFYEGFSYKEKSGNGVYKRTPHKMNITTVYGGLYVMGTKHLLNYGMKTNIPRNKHDISKARMSYSVVATNMRRMIPKSMIDSCIGFADMLQITHLKLQQAIAKAKPDGLIIDIEGLENVQLGKGGELQPLELHDIYEQTGVFYYRSKDPEGGFQNPPVREINNSIRNVNELVGLYNHYLKMIRDATGVNEVMDASSPKGDALVGVREQALEAGNNAIYDITNSSMVLFKKVCEDVVKCLQIIPKESVLMRVYENAIGEENMKVLSSFSDLPMYNFGVSVQKEMEDNERAYLEQNIQMAIAQKEIDLEDAIAVRNLKDVNQAERLLVVRRNKRIERMQAQAQQASQMQAQQAQQAAQQDAQARQQELQMSSQIDLQKIQMKASLEIEVAKAKHEFDKEIEMIRATATLGFKTEEQEFKEKLEVLKEDRKDSRVKKQASQQSKLLSQRQGKRGELQEVNKLPIEDPNITENTLN